MIEVFINTLTADYKDPVLDCDNLPFPIQLILSKNREKFSQFFLSLMEF